MVKTVTKTMRTYLADLVEESQKATVTFDLDNQVTFNIKFAKQEPKKEKENE